MKQITLASSGFEKYGKATKRSVFLAEMDRVVPWAALCELIAPVYPQHEVGRPPIGLERMLRIHFLQAWFNLSDPAVEERCTTPKRCGSSSGSIWGQSVHRTRRRSAGSGTC